MHILNLSIATLIWGRVKPISMRLFIKGGVEGRLASAPASSGGGTVGEVSTDSPNCWVGKSSIDSWVAMSSIRSVDKPDLNDSLAGTLFLWISNNYMYVNNWLIKLIHAQCMFTSCASDATYTADIQAQYILYISYDLQWKWGIGWRVWHEPSPAPASSESLGVGRAWQHERRDTSPPPSQLQQAHYGLYNLLGISNQI